MIIRIRLTGVSELILNGTHNRLYSATHVGSHWKIQDKRQIEMKIQTTQKLNTTQQKQTTLYAAKQNYSGSIAFYDTRPVNDGLIHNAPDPPHGAIRHMVRDKSVNHLLA